MCVCGGGEGAGEGDSVSAPWQHCGRSSYGYTRPGKGVVATKPTESAHTHHTPAWHSTGAWARASLPLAKGVARVEGNVVVIVIAVAHQQLFRVVGVPAKRQWPVHSGEQRVMLTCYVLRCTPAPTHHGACVCGEADKAKEKRNAWRLFAAMPVVRMLRTRAWPGWGGRATAPGRSWSRSLCWAW